MSKDISLINRIKESKNGAIFDDEKENMFTLSHCRKCGDDFVLTEQNHPMHDDPRVQSFYDVCDDCL